jgi:hypothetical protein
MHWRYGHDDVRATAKAVVVVTRGLTVVTNERGKHVNHEEVRTRGKQQRECSKNENAMTAHCRHHRMKVVWDLNMESQIEKGRPKGGPN